MFEKRGWRSACLEQLLLTPPLSMNFFRLKEWREWGVGNLHPFFKNSGAAMGLGDQGPSRQDPAHCRTAVILTVSPFEMYSGGFSKYEDLSNEFSILLQRRVLPCSCQRCSAVCEAQVGGGGPLVCGTGRPYLQGHRLSSETPRSQQFCLSEVIAVPHACPSLRQRTWKWGPAPHPPSPRCKSLTLLLSCREEAPWLLRQIVGFPSPPPLRPPLP